MSLTKQQLNELWELADKATPGPYAYNISSCYSTTVELKIGGLELLKTKTRADCIFHATCDPQTIKALIEMAKKDL